MGAFGVLPGRGLLLLEAGRRIPSRIRLPEQVRV